MKSSLAIFFAILTTGVLSYGDGGPGSLGIARDEFRKKAQELDGALLEIAEVSGPSCDSALRKSKLVGLQVRRAALIEKFPILKKVTPPDNMPKKIDFESEDKTDEMIEAALERGRHEGHEYKVRVATMQKA